MSDIQPSPPATAESLPTPEAAKPAEPAAAAPLKSADKAKTAPEPEMEKGTMTFWDHLDELRSRMFKMALAFAIGGGGSWYFKERIMAVVGQPLADGWVGGGPVVLNIPAPASMFLAYLKLSILAGLAVSLPIIFYQLWAFIAPGLYSKEKRLALPFVFVSTTLFVGGAWFGWVFAFPMAFQYLLSFTGQVGAVTIKPTIMIDDYIDFVIRLVLAFGVSFELPVIVFFLAYAGIVTHKQLIKFSRYFIVLAFLISAILTPPDVMSQFLLAVPLIALYFVSILIAWVVQKKPQTA